MWLSSQENTSWCIRLCTPVCIKHDTFGGYFHAASVCWAKSLSWTYPFCLEGQDQCVRQIYSGHEFTCLESQLSHSRRESEYELVCGRYDHVRAQDMNQDDSS